MGRKSNATKAAEAAQGVADQGASIGPSVVAAHNPRNDLIEELAKSAFEERREYARTQGVELPGEEEDPPIVAEEPAETVETEEVEETPEETQEETAEETETAEPAEELVTLKIDGQEQKVPRSKVEEYGIRAMQKELAADRKLEEATRLLNEAKAKFAQPSQDVVQQQPSNDAAELAKALQYGTEDDAVQAIKALQGRNMATPDQIAMMVDERVKFQNAVEWFQSEYSEINQDPYLQQIAVNAEAQKRAQGDQRPFKELYKEIGDEIMAWRAKIAPPKALADKQARKASVQTIPSASVRQTPSEPEKPESASDVVEQMRRARGQA